MIRTTHIAGLETANDLRARLAIYNEWVSLTRVAEAGGVPVNEPYPPTPVTPQRETAAMIARLRAAIEEHTHIGGNQ